MDTLIHASLMGGQARALIAWTTDISREAQRTHSASPVCTAAMGRVLTACCLLAADLKSDRESLSIQIKGGGIAGDAFGLARADGSVKGMIEYPQVELPAHESGAQDVGWALGSQGRLTVIRGRAEGEPYIGQVALQSGEVAVDVAYYLAKSEQTASMVALGEWLDSSGVRASAGLLLQPLPGCGEVALKRLEHIAKSYQPFSAVLKKAACAMDCAKPLEEMQPEILFEKPLVYRCDCSRERLRSVLASLGEKEIEGMIDEQHGAQVRCHFCSTSYDFSEDELRALLAAVRAKSAAGEQG